MSMLSTSRWSVTLDVMPQVVGFVPTGWMYEMKRRTFPVREKGPCKIHLVPYSEHSSYSELRDYVRFLRPVQVRECAPRRQHYPAVRAVQLLH